ncbi:MAG: hypothetical protein NVSMB66_4770 [Candidatus Doudnabacteria bacterium]
MGQTNGVETPFNDKADTTQAQNEDNRQLDHAADFLSANGILTPDELTELSLEAKAGSYEARVRLFEIADHYDISYSDNDDPTRLVNEIIVKMDSQDANNTFNGTE